VPDCYFLTVCGGSSVDQHSNNVSLFNLVEQVNVHPNAQQVPRGMLPLEIHAYWSLLPQQVGEDFQARFVLVAETGLETASTTFRHRPTTLRFRSRTMGVPYPPVFGDYTLCVDFRRADDDDWHRTNARWPLRIRLGEAKPAVTH
jgi:hypothetical protein